jgi:hypothetical protein
METQSAYDDDLLDDAPTALTVRLPSSLRDDFARVSKAKGRSMASQLRITLADVIEQHDRERLRKAARAREREAAS